MASITANRKNGVVISYRIRSFRGKDDKGVVLAEQTTFKVEPTWTEKFGRKKAEEYAAVWERGLKQGTASNTRQRFDDYCEYVISLKESTGTKRTTIERYRAMTGRVYPAFGFMKLRDITAKTLNKFYLSLTNEQKNLKNGKPLSARTVKHYHELISAILEQAFKEQLIPFNPARQTTLPKVEQKEVEIFTNEELKTLQEEIEKLPIKWNTLFSFLLNSGVRRGEAVGLKWSRVDFKRNRITIDNNVLQSAKDGLYDDTPKTASSVRTIGMPQFVMDKFKELQRWQKQERLRLGEYYTYREYVFTQDNGKPISPDSISTFCRRTLSPACGGIQINPHKFRHTHASLLIAKGVPITAVAKRLGHAQLSTTMNIYAHAMSNSDDEVVSMLEKVFGT